VESEIRGRPGLNGSLEIGLTEDTSVAVATEDPCERVEPIEAILSLTQVGTANGYVVGAAFDLQNVGWSTEITDDAPHQLRIAIDDHRRAEYSLDGVVFARSPVSPRSSECVPLTPRTQLR